MAGTEEIGRYLRAGLRGNEGMETSKQDRRDCVYPCLDGVRPVDDILP